MKHGEVTTKCIMIGNVDHVNQERAGVPEYGGASWWNPEPVLPVVADRSHSADVVSWEIAN